MNTSRSTQGVNLLSGREGQHASEPECPVQLINTAIRAVVPFDPDASDLPVAWCPALPVSICARVSRQTDAYKEI